MLQNNEAFAFRPGFLAVIGIVTRGSKVTFSGRIAAFSSLFQRLRVLITQKCYFVNLRRNNAFSDQITRVLCTRTPF